MVDRNLPREKIVDLYAAKPLTREQQVRKGKHLTTPVRQIVVTPEMAASDLVEQMAGMSIQARNLGQCARILERMMTDPDRPTVILGMAGPLIAAGLRRVIRDLVVSGAVDAVVSTGAIFYQDIYQARGYRHYKGTPQADDTELRDLYIDRIYDTYVDEEKFWETDMWCGKVADELPPGEYSSRTYLEELAKRLSDPESIVYQCGRLGIPMFAPALNDSSIGIGLTEHYHRSVREDRPGVVISSIRDAYELTQLVVHSKKTAAIYLAGGVPKNFINDSVVAGYIFGVEKGHNYAIQVTTANSWDGGLSGSTLSEAQSWGKIKKEADFAMAQVEPSVSVPLLAASLFSKGVLACRSRIQYRWEERILKELRHIPVRSERQPEKPKAKRASRRRVPTGGNGSSARRR